MRASRSARIPARPAIATNANQEFAATPAIAALLLLTALSGCASTAPDAAPDVASTSAASTASSPTATPTPAADPADPSTWLVDASGIGPILIGSELTASTSDLTGYTADDPAQCPNPEMRVFSSPTLPTLWIGVSSSSPTTIVSVSVGGDLTDATREASSPKTANGIAIGSTEADVVAAYPQAALTGEDPLVFYELGDASGPHVEIATFQGVVQTMSTLSTPYPVLEFCG